MFHIGPVPKEFFKLNKLTTITMGFQPISANMKLFKSLRYLTFLDIPIANFYGKISSSFCQIALTQVAVSYNDLTGTIPSCLSTLIGASFEVNHMNGTIPSQFLQLTSLTSLRLDYNDFTGTIPTRSYSTYFLSLYRNRFTGKLPCGNNGGTAYSLLLSFNHLTGTIPTCFKANIIDVSANRLSGSIPTKSMMSTFLASFNTLSGPLPSVGMNPHIGSIKVDKNNIEGM